MNTLQVLIGTFIIICIVTFIDSVIEDINEREDKAREEIK